MDNDNPRSQAKNWCFTLNNPDIDENAMVEALSEADYCVFQLEIGEAGTPHYQGYCMFPQKKRLSQLKRILRSAHWEVARGSPKQNRDYCTKADGRIGLPVEFGIFPEHAQGRRTDLIELQSALDHGLTQAEYATRYFEYFVKYPKLVQSYAAATTAGRTGKEEIECWLLIGPPGTGKSRYAAHIAAEWMERLGQRGRPPYWHDLGQWFDGYRGERVIILDDFRGSCLSFTTFKRLVDRYPFQVGVKGSSCTMGATHFIITTNISPDQWWKEEVTGREISAIHRRITRVLHFPELNRFCAYESYRDYALVHESPFSNGPQAQEILQEVSYEVEAQVPPSPLPVQEIEESWHAEDEILQVAYP